MLLKEISINWYFTLLKGEARLKEMEIGLTIQEFLARVAMYNALLNYVPGQPEEDLHSVILSLLDSLIRTNSFSRVT